MTRRYDDAVTEFTKSHLYTEAGQVVVEGRSPRVVARDTVYRITTDADPQVGPQAYMARSTDTIPFLAQAVFQDPTQWWRVAEANPHIRYPLDFRVADIIRLPE